MSQTSEKDLVDLLREAVDAHPSIAYGSIFRVIDASKVCNWLVDWVPRVQLALDDYEGCDKCELLNNRLT